MLHNILGLFALIGGANADLQPFYQSAGYDMSQYGAWPLQSYLSSRASGPILNYWNRSEACEKESYTLIAPRGDSVRHTGPMILDQNGNLVWFKEYPTTYNLNIQSFRGENYLTFWAGNDGMGGHGDGILYMLNSRYEEVYKIRGVNGLPADMHELQITRDDTALLVWYDKQPADLRVVGGSENGWIYDGGFQEVDIETNELLFQWRASDHFKLTDGYRGPDERGDSEDVPWDFFHINSVDKDSRGNYLVSSRYMSCLAYVDGKTGDVIWRLGGKGNSFQDLSDGSATNMKWQHHARFHDASEAPLGSEPASHRAITLFDNSSRGKGATERTSRGLLLNINEQDMTVQVRHEYWNPIPISSQSQGSLQVLDNGNILIGYGYNAAWTEFSANGDVLCEAHFGPAGGFGTGNIISYRTFKHRWTGRPTSSPDVAFAETHVAVSWNGATEVAKWALEGIGHAANWTDSADSDLDGFAVVSAVPKSGFETNIPVPDQMPYRRLRVVALDQDGAILGQTTPVNWTPDKFRNEVLVVSGEEETLSQRNIGRILLLVFVPLSVALFVFCLWLGRQHLQLHMWRLTFYHKLDQGAKSEVWLPLRVSDELEEEEEREQLDEPVDLEHCDQDVALLGKQRSRGLFR
ncbi:unnamed protein product [Penicillium salamii]|uniref:ASST-domain-containing protein n=1 Tax=Penicillium salamii TaxID=1612424 RepID=A0A9W4NST8_9EURO|nr:unnamed protein product [Penicillium salamii]